MENLELKKNFWKNKKVLITGNLGFKGSWLCLQLNYFKVKIYGIDNKSSQSSLISKNLKRYLVKQYICDVMNIKKLKTIIKEINPHIIIHLAAQPIVLDSYRDPLLTINVNILGVSNLIFASRNQSNLKSILIVTSDKVYENKDKNVKFIEKDKLGGDDIYSASKACAEIVSSSFYQAFFKKNKINLATARAGNVIGGGDISRHRLVPDIYRSINKKKKLLIRNKNHIRPWQHVLDCNNGYMLLIEKLYFKEKYSGPWNFSSNYKMISVEKLCIEFNKKLNFKYSFLNNKNQEKKILRLNSNKAKNKLKWKSRLSFQEMVSLTSSWYKDFLKNKRPDEICKIQIKRYYSSK